MLYPNKDEIQKFFENCEKYKIAISGELTGVLICLEEGITISEDQWKHSRIEYMSAQENCKNTKRSFDQRNRFLNNIFQKHFDEHYYTFSVTPSFSSDNKSTDSYGCDFQSRDSLIERYTLVFNNIIPAWFLKDLQQSIPQDAMDIVLTLSLSVMPQDKNDSEDFTEFEYIFEHTFDYFDKDQKDQSGTFTAYYTCENSDDAYQKLLIINSHESNYSEILTYCTDSFDTMNLERIIEEIDKKDIFHFDKELFRVIKLFEDCALEEKDGITAYIAKNENRKNFLDIKLTEWSEKKLKRVLQNRISNKFQLLMVGSENGRDIRFWLPENEHRFNMILSVIKNQCDKNLCEEIFSDWEKASLTVDGEIINGMITLKIKLVGTKKLNQIYLYDTIINIEQLYSLMKDLCPTCYGMDYSLQWLT